jgi:predicted DNA-binding protein (UPF0251 family)
MPRPRKPRFVEFLPAVTYFKPAGVPMAVLDEICLGVDELEALRLKDLEGLEQEECAKRMNLAQSTFQRLLSSAREKLTRGIVEGKAIRIEGGNYRYVARRFLCPDCGTRWEAPAGRDSRGVNGAEKPAAAENGVEAAGNGDKAAPRLHCPECGSREARPQWHRGRGHGPRRWRE